MISRRLKYRAQPRIQQHGRGKSLLRTPPPGRVYPILLPAESSAALPGSFGENQVTPWPRTLWGGVLTGVKSPRTHRAGLKVCTQIACPEKSPARFRVILLVIL
jgi:hypothetical protein